VFDVQDKVNFESGILQTYSFLYKNHLVSRLKWLFIYRRWSSYDQLLPE